MRQPDMGSFVDNYYSVAKFQAAYAGIIPSITDRSQWPEVDKGFILHPPNPEKERTWKAEGKQDQTSLRDRRQSY